MLYTHLSNGLMHVVVEGYDRYERETVVRFVRRIVQASLSFISVKKIQNIAPRFGECIQNAGRCFFRDGFSAPLQCVPVLPKPDAPRSVSESSSVSSISMSRHGVMTSCAMRSPFSTVCVSVPLFCRNTRSSPR